MSSQVDSPSTWGHFSLTSGHVFVPQRLPGLSTISVVPADSAGPTPWKYKQKVEMTQCRLFIALWPTTVAALLLAKAQIPLRRLSPKLSRD